MQTDEYLKLAEVEDRMWYFQGLHALALEALRRGLRPDLAGDVLDAGCGTGGFIKRALPALPGRGVAGIDFSPLACDLARQRGCPRVEVASITELPFADATFAALTSLDVLVQVVERERALAEFFRVLKPGGLVVINVAAYKWLWSYHDDSCQTQHRYTRPELVAQTREVGFVVEQATYRNFLTLPFVVAKRKLFRRATDTSDVKPYPEPVEAAFRGIMAAERMWLRHVGPMPAGSSVFLVARKPAAGKGQS